MVGAASCNFLDVVPDERPTEEDVFGDFFAARRYLYSCYSYLPNPKEGALSLDLLTGDEVVTAFEHEVFAKFCIGQFTATVPVISYWNTFFQGLRQCYIMLENIDGASGVDAATKEDYKAQMHFLIAYFHFLQIRCYGPCILVKSLPDMGTAKENYLGRSSLDECVDFVCSEFDKAAAGLPPRRVISYEEGLATSVAAKALKAKMLLYAASPLFNGGGPGGGGIESYLRGFKDKNGVQLMPLTFDPSKWTRAKLAIQEAITAAESAGYALDYATNVGNPHPQNQVDSRMRGIPMAAWGEMIWSDNRLDNQYGVAVKSLPHVESRAWNGVGPTLAMLKRFYTENGLPIEEDPDFYDEDKWWDRENIDSAYYSPNRDLTRFSNRDVTMNFNTMREPRYYAWVAFQGGFFEVVSAVTNGGYASDSSYSKWGPGRLVCNFMLGGNTSRQPTNEKSSYRTNDFSPSGFLNKKHVAPAMIVSKSSITLVQHPWPIIRLTDLYLMCAEACVETNELDVAKTYLDPVRERAGIPKVDEAWAKAKSKDKHNTQDGLREIVRQERQVELYLENQNFWDMRRWLLAAEKFEGFAQGMNVEGTKFAEKGNQADDTEAFNRVVDARGSGGIHHFANPTHYFLPIPIGDVSRNPNITQNPGY
jgi:hypothetical protein